MSTSCAHRADTVRTSCGHRATPCAHIAASTRTAERHRADMGQEEQRSHSHSDTIQPQPLRHLPHETSSQERQRCYSQVLQPGASEELQIAQNTAKHVYSIRRIAQNTTTSPRHREGATEEPQPLRHHPATATQTPSTQTCSPAKTP